jgi:hypothetical protein
MRLIINSSTLQNYGGTIRINIPSDIHIKKFAIISASIPYSFYNINSTSNTFRINGTSYALPQKNYNAYQLRDAINALIISTGVVVSFDKQALHYKFTKSTTGSFTLNTLSLGVIFGFLSNTTYTSSLIGGLNTLESIYAIDITNNNRNIYMKSNLNTNSVYENGVLGSSILYRIPINTTFGNIIYFQNDSETKLNDEIYSRITTLEFTLTDANQTILDLNNVSYQFELYLETSDDIVFKTQYTLINPPPVLNQPPPQHPYELLKTR